jgi:hypothetical protein
MLEHLTLALTEALQDEYKARATYRAILQRFGPVRPFVNIVEAEERHIQALLPLFAQYDIAVPEDNWPDRVTLPDSVTQACQDGVQAELENGAMYERLLAMTADYPEVQRVFQNLQRASQQHHLPAFQRCAARENPDVTGANCGDSLVSSINGVSKFSGKTPSQAEADGQAAAAGRCRYGRRRRRRRGNPG